MIARRDFLAGGLCIGAAGLGWKLEPRTHTSLMHGLKLQSLVPAEFGSWKSSDVSDLVAPTTGPNEDLYDDTMERNYFQERDDLDPVMVLMAHGANQTTEMVVHRPEVCYPAFGFKIVSVKSATLELGPRATISCKRLIAQRGDAQECVFYWTRLGELFPVSNQEERAARLRTAMEGVIPDGVLVRFSVLSKEPDASFSRLERFAAELVHAIPWSQRDALIGKLGAATLAR